MYDELKHVGLSDEEIAIYTTLLRFGSLKVTTIAKKLVFARSTVYRFIDMLHERGLVSEVIENGVKVYSPLDPKKIPEVLLDQVHEVKSIVPSLSKLYRPSFDTTKVSLLRGIAGFKSIMNDIVKEKRPYTFIGDAEKYFQIDLFTKNWFRKVEDAKIQGRLLISKDQRFEVAKTEKYRFVPRRALSEISAWTYGDKTAQFVWLQPYYAILIESREVAQSNRKTFNFLWKGAKKG